MPTAVVTTGGGRVIRITPVPETLCNVTIQPSPDRRFCGVKFEFTGWFALNDERLCLLTHWSSRLRFAGATISHGASWKSRPMSAWSSFPRLKQATTAGASGAGRRLPFLTEETAAGRHCHIPSHRSFRQPICGLDEACLTGDRLRLDRLPATTNRRFLTPDPFGDPPLPLTNLRLAALHFIAALTGAVRSSPVFATAIEAAMGVART